MKRFLLLVGVLLVTLGARAQLTIEIPTSPGRQIPIAVSSMAGESSQPQSVSEVVGSDLARSGLFKLVSASGVSPLPSEPSEVNFGDWSARGADALVIGKIQPQSDGRVEVRFRLFDVQKTSQLASYSYVVAPQQLRATAHRIADVIYERLTGDKGVFSTKITYVVKRGRRHELQVADADGFNAQTVLASNEPIISPSWSPDGSRLAYVSFDQKKPVVVVQNLAQGTTRIVANFRGNNSAPAWSPDGRVLAVALSKDGLTQIYRISANGGEPQRLTESSGIDTQPNFSPDGQWIAFTRTQGNSYNDASATAWVVKADGTLPPIQLSLANKGTGGLTNSWSRWTPFAATTGDDSEQVFYLTFSTTRPFGIRPTGGTQIWMTPFFPQRAAQGLDPSGPAFHMPFQLLTSANHIAQWTQQVVVQ